MLDGLLTPDAATLSDEQLTGQLDEIFRRAEVEDELARIRERLVSAAGHRTVPHTADLRIEAWAPTREECLAEAVHGLVDSFAVVAGRAPSGRARRHLTARLDEDLLVAVIDEVIYRLDADGQIPVSADVRRAPDGGVIVVFALVPRWPRRRSPARCRRQRRCMTWDVRRMRRAAGRARSRSTCSRYPFTTPRDTRRATFRHSPAPSAASTTRVTSL